MAEYHYIPALQSGSTARPWTRKWMGVINLEAEVSRQAVYDDTYSSLANSREYLDLFASGEPWSCSSASSRTSWCRHRGNTAPAAA
jgi:hypothetical protein